MAANRKTSKLARVLVKDLQGEQVIYRNFQEGKISVLRDNRDKYFSAVPGFQGRQKVLKIVTITVLVVALSLFYFQKKRSGEQGLVCSTWLDSITSKTLTVTPVFQQSSVGKKTFLAPSHLPATHAIITSMKDAVSSSPCMLKKSSYGRRGNLVLTENFYLPTSVSESMPAVSIVGMIAGE